MRKKILFPAALLLLVFSFVLSLCVGSAQISIREAVSALQNGSLTPDSRILFYVRLPRALAAVLSGAALAVSGVLLQNVLNNALAAPNIIGVNAGAGFAVLFLPVSYTHLLQIRNADGNIATDSRYVSLSPFSSRRDGMPGSAGFSLKMRCET